MITATEEAITITEQIVYDRVELTKSKNALTQQIANMTALTAAKQAELDKINELLDYPIA